MSFPPQIQGHNGLFAGGNAHASVEAFACDDDFEDRDFDFVDRTSGGAAVLADRSAAARAPVPRAAS